MPQTLPLQESCCPLTAKRLKAAATPLHSPFLFARSPKMEMRFCSPQPWPLWLLCLAASAERSCPFVPKRP